MRVTTTTLEMLAPPALPARPLPDDVRLERADGITPEYARFLYGLVGGPWHWTDRLGWSRQQWLDDLAVPGSEVWVLTGEGVPLGYVQLQPQPLVQTGADASGHAGADAPGHASADTPVAPQVEVRYFGLAEQAIGRGLGGRLLEHAVAAAWSLPQRAGLAPAARVWVHTCSLDGPAALANYQARGFVVCGTEVAEQTVAEQPLGAWASTGGPA